MKHHWILINIFYKYFSTFPWSFDSLCLLAYNVWQTFYIFLLCNQSIVANIWYRYIESCKWLNCHSVHKYSGQVYYFCKRVSKGSEELNYVMYYHLLSELGCQTDRYYKSATAYLKNISVSAYPRTQTFNQSTWNCVLGRHSWPEEGDHESTYRVHLSSCGVSRQK